MNHESEQFLTDRAVSARYAIARETVWRWAKDGRLPAPLKIQGTTRWRLSDLMAYEKELNSEC
jgi:prophage regulatory protein